MSALFEATALVVPFENLRMTDVESVGGKNASLGEMISQLPQGVRVPTGFATTAHAFRQFLAHDGLADKISARLAALNTEDVRALAAAGAEIRAMVEAQPFPADLQQAIAEAFAKLSQGNPAASFAVRSSATAEDLPDASFAGQQETFLNIRRYRPRAGGDSSGVCFALQRPGDLLPGASGIRTWRRGPVGRGAADGAQRPRRLRRHVHDLIPSPDSPTWFSSLRLMVWAKSSFRAPSTRTSSMCTSRCSPLEAAP